MQDCWILVAGEARMQAISSSVDIAWWEWIGRVPCSQRGGVDIVQYRWSALTSVPFPFTRCRSMVSGLLLR